MSQAQTKDFTFAVTNPLHYVYYAGRDVTRSVATRGSLAEEYAEILGFGNISFVDSANSVAGIIEADTPYPGPYLSWRSAHVNKPMLGNPYELTSRIESKAAIRELIDADLFAPHLIVGAAELEGIYFDDLTTQLGATKLVAQIDHSTGGKGTFFLNDESDYERAKSTLMQSGQKIVVSELVEGESRALQCLHLHSETYMPQWWHRDLVSISGIYNEDVTDATRYCGAILENIPDARKAEAAELARTVGNRIGMLGYEGVFGIDIVVPSDDSKPIVLIEVNARLTAVSHLYAGAMRASGYATDYMTLGFEYAAGLPIDMVGLREKKALTSSYYYLKLQNLEDAPLSLNDTARLGVYGAANEYLRLGWGIDSLINDEEIIVIPETARHIQRAPGQRTFSIIGTGNPLDGSGLSETMRRRIAALNASMLQ